MKMMAGSEEELLAQKAEKKSKKYCKDIGDYFSSLEHLARATLNNDEGRIIQTIEKGKKEVPSATI